MIRAIRLAASMAIVGCAAILSGGCGGSGGQSGTPIVTNVVGPSGVSVVTLQKTFSLSNCAGTAPLKFPPTIKEPQDWWNSMPAANQRYPFAGWHVLQPGPGGCAGVRIDEYRAVAVLGLDPALKGLVQKAELIVETQALPSAVTGAIPAVGPLGAPGSINLFCPSMQGGAGALVRFGPGAAVPQASGIGRFEMLDMNPFPSGTNTVYTMPTSFAPGPVANASNPTVAAPSGNGGSTYATDVTGAVTAALNSNMTTLSWMLTSNFEGPLPASLAGSGEFDCRTSYNISLKITHF